MAEAQLAGAADLARDIEEGLASATTATERAALVPEELIRAIGLPKCQVCTHCFDGSSHF